MTDASLAGPQAIVGYDAGGDFPPRGGEADHYEQRAGFQGFGRF